MGHLLRARKNEDKEVRRLQILKAAKRLFESQGFDGITMDLIAKKSELAKGTLYLYFKTKEEVFLDLQAEELFTWMRILKDQLELLPGKITPEEFIEHVVTYTENQHTLLNLLALLHVVLEKNLSKEKAKTFKLELKAHMTELARTMSTKVEGFTSYNSFAFLMRTYSLIIGLWQTANPSPLLKQVYKDPELAVFKLDFAVELKESLQWMIAGMLQNKTGRDGKFDFFNNY